MGRVLGFVVGGLVGLLLFATAVIGIFGLFGADDLDGWREWWQALSLLLLGAEAVRLAALAPEVDGAGAPVAGVTAGTLLLVAGPAGVLTLPGWTGPVGILLIGLGAVAMVHGARLAAGLIGTAVGLGGFAVGITASTTELVVTLVVAGALLLVGLVKHAAAVAAVDS